MGVTHRPQPNAFETAMTTFLTLALTGMGVFIVIKLILEIALGKRMRQYQDLQRPTSRSLPLEVSLWLTDQRNTVTTHGFVILLSSASAFFPDPGLSGLPAVATIAALYVVVLVLIAYWRVLSETFIPSLEHRVLLGTSERAVQRACWFVAVFLAALALVWLGVMLRQWVIQLLTQ